MRTLSRSLDAELIDSGTLDHTALARNLAEMAMLNRLPGGAGASVSAVLRSIETAERLPVLDVGTGGGDFVRRLRRRCGAPIIAVDADPAVVALARAHISDVDNVTVLLADARMLPLGDASVSVAHCSLLVHHLDPADVVTALSEMRRVARAGVVVNDLRRSRAAYALTAAAVFALARSPVTRHDGLLSARRAYTLAELDDLAAQADLHPVARSPGWWPRVTTTYR